MYTIIVIALLFVLPLVSTLVELAMTTGDVVSVAGKWLVFWAIGVRLVMAGLKQVSQPAFTAQTIFRLTDEAAFPIVREVGFGNLSIGALGLLSLAVPTWTVPAALVGGLYYLLAGLGHVANAHRNAHEQTAMITDIIVAIMLLAFVAAKNPLIIPPPPLSASRSRLQQSLRADPHPASSMRNTPSPACRRAR